ncbi:MAG: hypothetical protein WC552_05410 [Candidatus Omnitrophota bacterium]
MRLSQLVKAMVFITVLSLIYIHMQMNILDLAYQGKIKEKIVRQLNEDNGLATYNILKLKSVNNLGDQLLDEKSGLCFLDNTNIVELKTTEESGQEQKLALAAKSVKKTNMLLNFFSLKSQAEARPQE